MKKQRLLSFKPNLLRIHVDATVLEIGQLWPLYEKGAIRPGSLFAPEQLGFELLEEFGGTMSKTGTCAYCAAGNVVLTIEHVFPESWYPDDHLPSAMLTVPACSPCNGAYDRIEKKLFLPLVISQPTDPRTASILERAIRSAEAASGKSERDREHRQKKADSFFRRTKIVGERVPVEAPWTPVGRQLATFVTESGMRVQGTPTVEYGWENLEAIAIKFLRGCYFDRFGVPLRSDLRTWARAFPEDPREMIGQWQQMPSCTTVGDFPFWHCLAVDAGQSRAGAFFILWDSLVLFASNLPVPSEA